MKKAGILILSIIVLSLLIIKSGSSEKMELENKLVVNILPNDYAFYKTVAFADSMKVEVEKAWGNKLQITISLYKGEKIFSSTQFRGIKDGKPQKLYFKNFKTRILKIVDIFFAVFTLGLLACIVKEIKSRIPRKQ